MQELQMVANNIANASTTGFRREGLVFSEFIQRLGREDESLSMTTALVRDIDLSQGTLVPTGSPFDLAIEGDGFFQVETPEGPMMTRAGAFTANEAGELSTMDGRRVLDIGGAAIFVPPGAADLAVSRDGTVSAAGLPIGQVAVVVPTDRNSLSRHASGLFTASGVEPAQNAVVLQGFVEKSNVNPIAEITRMIEVQHAYEQGAKFLDREDERIRAVISTLGR
jgi:flagellar basal-body rod protein FlgF